MAMLIAALCAEGTSTIGDAVPDRPAATSASTSGCARSALDRARRRALGSPACRRHAETRRCGVARRIGDRQRRRSRPGCRARPPGRPARAHAGFRLDARGRARTAPTRRSQAAGRALGDALAEPAAPTRRCAASAGRSCPSDEALATCVARASRTARSSSRTSTSRASASAASRPTSSSRFLQELARGAPG